MGVADAQALAMPVALGVPGARLSEGGAEAQALALPHPGVELGVAVRAEEGVALADPVSVGHGGLGEALPVARTLLLDVECSVPVGEAEAQAHTEGVREAEGEASAVAVALASSAEPVHVLEAVPQALALLGTLGVRVVLELTELLLHRVKAAVAEVQRVAERVELEVREAQREALTQALAVPHPLAAEEAEGHRLPLPVALALGETEGVPVGASSETEGRAEEDCVLRAGEGLPVPHAHGLGDCEEAGDAERDAAGEGQGLELPVPVPPPLAEDEGAAVREKRAEALAESAAEAVRVAAATLTVLVTVREAVRVPEVEAEAQALAEAVPVAPRPTPGPYPGLGVPAALLLLLRPPRPLAEAVKVPPLPPPPPTVGDAVLDVLALAQEVALLDRAGLGEAPRRGEAVPWLESVPPAPLELPAPVMEVVSDAEADTDTLAAAVAHAVPPREGDPDAVGEGVLLPDWVALLLLLGELLLLAEPVPPSREPEERALEVPETQALCTTDGVAAPEALAGSSVPEGENSKEPVGEPDAQLEARSVTEAQPVPLALPGTLAERVGRAPVAEKEPVALKERVGVPLLLAQRDAEGVPLEQGVPLALRVRLRVAEGQGVPERLREGLLEALGVLPLLAPLLGVRLAAAEALPLAPEAVGLTAELLLGEEAPEAQPLGEALAHAVALGEALAQREALPLRQGVALALGQGESVGLLVAQGQDVALREGVGEALAQRELLCAPEGVPLPAVLAELQAQGEGVAE